MQIITQLIYKYIMCYIIYNILYNNVLLYVISKYILMGDLLLHVTSLFHLIGSSTQEEDQEGDGWMASEGICRHCGSPRRMRRTEHSRNQEFGLLTLPSGKRRRRRRIGSSTLRAWVIKATLTHVCLRDS